jgi:hypothetical protein
MISSAPSLIDRIAEASRRRGVEAYGEHLAGLTAS